MKYLLERLCDENHYRFGDPWRVSSKSLSFVIPIIRVKPPRSRGYVVVEEVKDKLEIEDTGSIREVRVKGDVDKPVFFRGGGILKGVGTQSRAVQYDVIVVPKKEETIKVLCVHASHPIRTGRKFRIVSGVAPRPIYAALAMGNQSATWSAVSSFAARAAQTTGFGRVTDSLVETLEVVDRFREDVKKKLEKIPGTLENQVGVAVINEKGVVGLEVFDHPDSWKAFSDSVIRHYEDVLLEEAEAEIFKLDESKIVPAIISFLEKAKRCSEEEVWSSKYGRTVSVKGEDIIGQYTTFNGNIIHLILTKKEKLEREARPQILWTTYTRETSTPPTSHPDRWRDNWMQLITEPTRYFARKGAWDFLKSLTSGPKTFKDLEPKFRSTATLSRRAKEAVFYGLAEKTIRPTNGRTVYRLTNKGKKALEAMAAQWET
ncbi:MAG: hypothetical protein J7K62_02420 [Thermoplasmata archaeon]|nr:hypothetical protein [Thermoplasmata archaeon]